MPIPAEISSLLGLADSRQEVAEVEQEEEKGFFENLFDFSLFGEDEEQFGEGFEMDEPEPPTAREIMSSNITALEGDYAHTDIVGIDTLPYGLRKDLHGDAAQGKNKQELKEMALDVFDATASSIAPHIPEWKDLSEGSRFILTDAKYNTGDTYKGLARDMLRHDRNPTPVTLAAVVKQTRRKAGGKYGTGMDNRAVKELIAAGYIDRNDPEHIKIVEEHLPKVAWDKL